MLERFLLRIKEFLHLVSQKEFLHQVLLFHLFFNFGSQLFHLLFALIRKLQAHDRFCLFLLLQVLVVDDLDVIGHDLLFHLVIDEADIFPLFKNVKVESQAQVEVEVLQEIHVVDVLFELCQRHDLVLALRVDIGYPPFLQLLAALF